MHEVAGAKLGASVIMESPRDEINPLAEGIMSERRPDPCTIVIFGASGDLTARKLIPALYNLSADGYLPSRFAILGVARREKTDDSFRTEITEAAARFSRKALEMNEGASDDWENFGRRVFYHRLSFDDQAGYGALRERIQAIEADLNLPPNRLFYLATRPSQFGMILGYLREFELIVPPATGSGWQRAVIEKPFGHDLESARALNRIVAKTLDESQAFRIDHYLGKETVQNLLTFRFANAIFEPIWNRRHIASVQITAAETIGMEGGRGGYYDTAGALRDMLENHLMQLLCLVAMEPPSRLDADAIRNEKVKVLQTLDPMTPQEVAASTVRGQYDSGSILGHRVPAYREESGVAKDSITESYVALRLQLENWRWAGVPFYLRTGKRMPKRATEIAIQFRVPPIGLFQQKAFSSIDRQGDRFAPNSLLLHIQPNEGISLMFDAKTPGMRMETQKVKMVFRYGSSFSTPSPEAYERLLLDSLIGDSTLFTRNDEVEAAWEFVTSIHEGWKNFPQPELPNYAAGEWGPAEADRLFQAGEGAWRKL